MDTMNRLQQHDQTSIPVTAEEIVASMRMGKKTTTEIRMGGRDIPMRVLSCDEINMIRRHAMMEAAKVGGDETDKNLYIQKHTLQMASKLTHNGAPTLTDKILSLLLPDELSYLYEEWVRFMDTVNPSLEQLTPEKWREIVDALKKNILSPRDLSLLQLRAICSSFVDMIQRQETQT